MVRQYSQKLLRKKTSVNTSLIRLVSVSLREERKSRMISLWALSERVNRPLVPASWPWLMVALCKEEFGSRLLSQ